MLRRLRYTTKKKRKEGEGEGGSADERRNRTRLNDALKTKRRLTP